MYIENLKHTIKANSLYYLITENTKSTVLYKHNIKQISVTKVPLKSWGFRDYL